MMDLKRRLIVTASGTGFATRFWSMTMKNVKFFVVGFLSLSLLTACSVARESMVKGYVYAPQSRLPHHYYGVKSASPADCVDMTNEEERAAKLHSFACPVFMGAIS